MRNRIQQTMTDARSAVAGAVRRAPGGERALRGVESFQSDNRVVLGMRDLAEMKSEKTVVLALLVQIVIAAFSSFLVVGVASVYASGDATEVVVTGNASDVVADADYPDASDFYVTRETEAEAFEELSEGDADVVIVADRMSSEVINATVYLPDGSLESTVSLNRVKETLQRLEHQERLGNQERLHFEVLTYPADAPSNTYYTFAYTKLLPLLVFIPVFLSGSVVVDSVTEERTKGTFDLLRTTPLSLRDIVISKTGVAIVFGAGQVVMWLLLLAANGIVVHNPVQIVLLALGLIAMTASLGVYTVIAVSDRKYGQLLYSFGVIGVFAVLGTLPQHPANTLSRLAIGGAQLEASLSAIAVFVLGVLVTQFVLLAAPRTFEWLEE